MEQNARPHLLVDRFAKREPKLPAPAEPAGEDCWLDEHQWLAGLPAASCGTVLCGWWLPK